MKKLGIYIMLLAFGLASCGGEEKSEDSKTEGETKQEESKEKNTNISGKIIGSSGEELKFALYSDTGKPKEIGTAKTNENGEFSFDFSIDGIGVIYIGFNGQNISLLAESGDQIVMNTNKDNLINNIEVDGSKTMKVFNAYLRKVLARRDEIISLSEKYNQMMQNDPDQAAKIKTEIDKIMGGIKEWNKEKIKENPDLPGNYLLLQDLSPQQGLVSWDESNMEYFRIVLTALKTKYPENVLTKKLDNDIASWEAQLENVAKQKERIARYGDLNKKIEVGAPAPDIFLDDPNGKEIKLSDLKGKIVLLDFWASWCGPCRKTNPLVVNVYHKYKDKGFTIYSVSLDQDKEKWLQAIKTDGLTWENHVSDLAGWESIAARLYKVNSIPSTFLIDKKGIIRAVRIHPSELEQKLQALL